MSQLFYDHPRSAYKARKPDSAKSRHILPQNHIRAARRSLLFLFSILLFLCFWKFLQEPPNFLLTEEQRFVRFTEQVFRNEMSGNTLSLHYTLTYPENYEISVSEVSLGDASAAAYQKSNAVLENYYKALLQFDRSKLSAKRQLTYDVFLSYLETELSAAELYLYHEPLSPTLGIQAQLPILLAEYTFHTKGDIEDYLCLLTQIPDYFSSILSFEQTKAQNGLFMSDSSAEEVILQCQQFLQNTEDNYLITVFNEKIDEISNLTADEKIAYQTRNQSILLSYVVPAYQTLISGLSALLGSGQNEQGLCYLPAGQQYYKYLVQSTTGDSRSLDTIEEAIKAQLVNDFTAIQNLLQTDSALQSQSSEAPGSTSPAGMLQDLRQKIQDNFPLLSAVSCDIKYVHESLQQYLSPAFYLTPTLDHYEENVIYLNPASDYSNLELYTTLAHEGYPGHLYQSVYFVSTEPDLLRCILDTGGYTEGWATYVELEYAYTFWDSTSADTALGRYNRSFTLGLASLLDIGIHYRGYSITDVEAFLVKLGFQSETTQALYNNILQSPANYLQYYVGYLNFCDLKKQQQEKLQDAFSLKDFHRTILETGPVPFDLLQKQF